MLKDLQTLPAEAVETGLQLTQKVKQLITNNDGALPFAHYMESVLYEPGLGYYMNGSPKFGVKGDFVTAPEMTPLFGQCLGHQLIPLLSQCDTPVIFELGAGTGQLAATLLTYLDTQDQLPDVYWILELSSVLKQRQIETLSNCCPHLLHRVQWLTQLPENDFEGVVIGNEVIDAIPAHRFRWYEQHIIEMGVTTKDDRFAWRPCAVPDPMVIAAIDAIPDSLKQQWCNGYTSEVRPLVEHWLAALSQPFRRGAMVWIDYGCCQADYYHPHQSDGTLMCYYRHHGHSDPFVYPGLQDITVSVDFTALAEAALACDLELLAYTSQAQFLLANKLESHYQAFVAQNPNMAANQALHMRRLVMPDQMGERFKVMVMGRGIAAPESLSMIDNRHRL